MDVLTALTVSPDNSYPRAILFDLPVALLNSWSLQNRAVDPGQAGRTWYVEYLRSTYGYGMYVFYEAMVRQAVQGVDLSAFVPAALEANWLQPVPWSGVAQAPVQFQSHCKLVVVTSYSERLGRQAAVLLPITWDVVIAAEQAGVYKPDPKLYRMALEQLGVDVADAMFMVGSSHDIFGTATVGLHTYWHNRIGLTSMGGAQLSEITPPTLDDLLP